jgi:hypothetical protein
VITPARPLTIADALGAELLKGFTPAVDPAASLSATSEDSSESDRPRGSRRGGKE